MLQPHLKTVKHEFEHAQEENRDRKPHLLEEPKIKKFRGCDSSAQSLHSSDGGQVMQILYSRNSVS